MNTCTETPAMSADRDSSQLANSTPSGMTGGGLLPIVFERINNFFAPVITSEQLVEWIAR